MRARPMMALRAQLVCSSRKVPRSTMCSMAVCMEYGSVGIQWDQAVELFIHALRVIAGVDHRRVIGIVGGQVRQDAAHQVEWRLCHLPL